MSNAPSGSVSPVSTAGGGEKMVVVENRISDQEMLLRWCQEKLKPIIPFLPVTGTCLKSLFVVTAYVHIWSTSHVIYGHRVTSGQIWLFSVQLQISIRAGGMEFYCAGWFIFALRPMSIWELLKTRTQTEKMSNLQLR